MRAAARAGVESSWCNGLETAVSAGAALRRGLLGVAAVALAIAAGCGSVENRSGAQKFVYTQEQEKGAVIVLSAGANEKCFSFATRLKLLRADAPYNGPAIAFLPVDSYAVKSEFSDHQGYLHVLRLPPGSYYLAPYINNPALEMKEVPRADFSVSAGEVAYLGEYFLQRACGLSGSAVFRDQWERDMALLKARNPALAQAPIARRVLGFTGQARL
jgi:hypothetical protein